MKKAIILTANKFEDMELYFPLFRLLEEGFQVDVAAPKMKELQGEHGYSIMPVKTIDEINPAKYDLLVLPGGSPTGAPATVRKIKHAQEIAKYFFAKNKPVASICHGPYTLVSADLVKGRHLTSYWYDGVPEEIKKAGGIWEDKSVVVDGNLITARHPNDLPDFMRAVVKMMKRK